MHGGSIKPKERCGMKKLAITWHILLAILGIGVLGGIWAYMFVAGTGWFFGPYRSVRIGDARVVQYLLLIYSLIGMPAGVFSACRVVQLATAGGSNRFAHWQSLRPMSRLFSVLATILIITGVAAENPIATLRSLPIFGGSDSSGDTGPSEEGLDYPELPLTPPDPYAWSIYDLEGNEVTMDTFRGKVVFLNAWTTWCGFCVLEFPNIQRLHEHMKDRDDIVVLAVSPEDPEVVRKWVDEKDFQIPFYTLVPAMAEGDPRPQFPKSFPVRVLPTTYIIAPDGQIAYSHTGMAAWDGQKTVDFLKMLAKSAP
jgi:peroxiredoxin